MAWVERRPHGWVVRWQDADGKHTSGAYGSKPEASAAAREHTARTRPARRRRKPGERPVEPLTIGQIAALWKAAKLADAERMRRPGAADYLETAVSAALAAAKALSWARPGDATPEAVAEWRTRHHQRGVHRPAAYLRGILRWGRDHHGTKLDQRVYAALRPPPSKRADVDLLTDDQVQHVLARADHLGVRALFSCLLTYGWRPITACRIEVRHVRGDGTIQIGIKHTGEPWTHPLFPGHVEQIRQLTAKRKPGEPLFLDPRTGEGWRIHKGKATALSCFYRDHLQPETAQARTGDIYALKRVALSRMASGLPPWRARLDLADVRLYTGHKADQQVMRYLTTNIDRARGVMGELAEVAPYSPPAKPPRVTKTSRGGS